MTFYLKLSIIALVAFFLSLSLHIISFYSFQWPLEPELILLVLGIGFFVLLIPLIVREKRIATGRVVWSWKKYFAYKPTWVKVIFYMFFAYMFLNFGLVEFLSESGVPINRNGTYFLDDHGKTIRLLTKAEYVQYKNYQVRGITGSLMVFYLIVFFYFYYIKPEDLLESKIERSPWKN